MSKEGIYWLSDKMMSKEGIYWLSDATKPQSLQLGVILWTALL
jgi:hypothetical protein